MKDKKKFRQIWVDKELRRKLNLLKHKTNMPTVSDTINHLLCSVKDEEPEEPKKGKGKFWGDI